jgi:hypothetical protein
MYLEDVKIVLGGNSNMLNADNSPVGNNPANNNPVGGGEFYWWKRIIITLIYRYIGR